MTRVSLLGSTGSIGRQAIDVVRANPEQFEVVSLGAWRSVDVLAAQARELHPQVIALGDDALASSLKELVDSRVEIRAGAGALESICTDVDVVLNGVVGFAGLGVTLATLKAGRRLALANKESLVAGGPVVRAVRDTPGAETVPVDSEHCAIHQCLRSGRSDEVQELVLTSSGGPFRGRTAKDLADVGVEDALAHPTWSMGPKVTIDSSTLMNKGLEVIEAHELFDVDFDSIGVVVHPQSIVHSMVTFTDGSTIAQLSNPTMCNPIGYALSYPDRLPTPFGEIDWTQLNQLDFETPDRTTFRGLELAYAAGREGGAAPAWLNAANEVAVTAFLDFLIGWAEIADVVEEVLATYLPTNLGSVDDVVEADRMARVAARAVVEEKQTA